MARQFSEDVSFSGASHTLWQDEEGTGDERGLHVDENHPKALRSLKNVGP